MGHIIICLILIVIGLCGVLFYKQIAHINLELLSKFYDNFQIWEKWYRITNIIGGIGFIVIGVLGIFNIIKI